MQEKVTSMLCPICKLPLTMSDRQGVEIDYCPQCRGVCLDRGELDKIIERSIQTESTAPQDVGRGYSDDGGSRGGKHGGGHRGQDYRRRSWLQDIFH